MSTRPIPDKSPPNACPCCGRQNATIVRRCVTCGHPFSIEVDEQQWWARKGFPFPRRCRACRRDARETDGFVNRPVMKGGKR